MGYRSFRDSRGVEWQAWDIIPRLTERRYRQRRSELASVDRDRRERVDRRKLPGERIALSAGLHGGWLCFQNREEKRRLSPIPADWLRCALTTLEEYLSAAAPAARHIVGVELPMLADLDRRAG